MSTLAAVNLKNPSSATNNVVLATNGDLQFNSGYGSAATAYGCRAWVNFNGTGTVAIRASGNVSSIIDNGTGDYTVNFTTAMVDANYAVVATQRNDNQNFPGSAGINRNTALSTSAFRLYSGFTGSAASLGGVVDTSIFTVAIFR